MQYRAKGKILQKIGLLLSMAIGFGVACSSIAQAAQANPGKTSPTNTMTKAASGEWEKVVEAAKKEGKVVVYTTAPGEMRQALQSGFSKKFGIDVEVTAFRGGESGARLLSERRAGIYPVDVYVGGATTPITQFKPAGVLDP